MPHGIQAKEDEALQTMMFTMVLDEEPPKVDSSSLPAGNTSLFDSRTLRGLTFAAKRALAEKLVTKWFLPGECLLRQGQDGIGMYIVEEGEAEIRVAQAGDSRPLAVVVAGSIVGEMSLLTGSPCTATVQCIQPTRALLLASDDFDSLRNVHPEIEIALSQLVSDRLGMRETDALCGKSIGGYRLNRCVNRGGMGVVYQAIDENDKPVALKMLRHRFVHKISFIERFVREGQTLRQLSHPNIVSVENCFVAFNTRFLAMDYWDGQDLSIILHERKTLPEETCRAILGQIARGLQYSHEHGILHLDIKPANILLDKAGHAALTDFGLCKLIGESEEVQNVVGTLPYMPPEQFRSTGGCQASDWYALALTAAEMLTGERLFPQVVFEEAEAAKAVARPSADWPRLPASKELSDAIVAALFPDAAQRTMDLNAIARWAALAPGLC